MTGDAWRRAREAHGLTLRRLAQTVGISAPFLLDVEHGRRRFSAAVEARMREALGLAPEEPSTSRCVMCEGPLTVKYRSQPTIHDPNGVIGPGYEPIVRGYEYADGFTCPKCGLHYDAAPTRSQTDAGARRTGP